MYKSINFVLIGCGGTGSWISHPALQLLNLASVNFSHPSKAIFIDGDLVEYKNTLRQAFNQSDIGSNKAYALVSRYSKIIDDSKVKLSVIRKFILDDKDRTEYLDKFITEDLANLFVEEEVLTIVVSVIDNNKTRKAVHESFSKCYYPHLIIDAGNEDIYGQVTVSSYCEDFKNKFQTYWDLHPEMMAYNDGVKAGPSCAEHDEVEANAGVTQTISANRVSASIAVGYLEKFFAFDFNVKNETGFVINNGKYTLSYK